MVRNLFLSFIGMVIIFSCEKNITVDLPEPEKKIVVEGWIEPGLPPFIILTRNSPYFGPTDLKSFEGSFIHNAIIKIVTISDTFLLTEYCSSTFNQIELEQISEAVGISVETLQSVDYCMYSNLAISGQVGHNYKLIILSEGKEYISQTQIPNLVPLDSVFFKVEKDRTAQGLGFAFGVLKDPDSLGNGYRWETKRLGKDDGFLAPYGSSFNDLLINGKHFEFGFNRPSSGNENSNAEESGYFKIGDTIVVKFSTIDQAHYNFLFSYENYRFNAGNPFASPSTIKTNITGNALGVWGGYGVSYDTIIAR